MKTKFNLEKEMESCFAKAHSQALSEAIKRGIRQAKLNKLAKQNEK